MQPATKPLANIPVGANSLDGVYDSTNGDVYVFNLGSGSASVIDGATNKVFMTITGLPSPVAGAFDSANGKIYVANYGPSVVSVIDGSTNMLVNSVTVQEGPAGALFNPDNNKIYVANQNHVGGGIAGNTLPVIDGSNDSVIDTIVILGPSPVGLAYNPDNHIVYVTNFGSNEQPGNTVTLLSTTSIGPDTAITAATGGNGNPVSKGSSTVSTSIHIAFSGIGPNIVSFECSLDGRSFSTCSSPFVANNLAAGVKQFYNILLKYYKIHLVLKTKARQLFRGLYLHQLKRYKI